MSDGGDACAGVSFEGSLDVGEDSRSCEGLFVGETTMYLNSGRNHTGWEKCGVEGLGFFTIVADFLELDSLGSPLGNDHSVHSCSSQTYHCNFTEMVPTTIFAYRD